MLIHSHRKRGNKSIFSWFFLNVFYVFRNAQKDSDESPGVYLRDDFLGGPTELRAPTAERAALFLDAALAGRQSGLKPALIFTLHVYQYSLAGKGGVAGGRSRLHLIDFGGCANRSGGLPLSGIGNILLAILSGQRHPPNRDHPLTPLLKDCLAPLMCHVSVLAHISHAQVKHISVSMFDKYSSIFSLNCVQSISVTHWRIDNCSIGIAHSSDATKKTSHATCRWQIARTGHCRYGFDWFSLTTKTISKF